MLSFRQQDINFPYFRDFKIYADTLIISTGQIFSESLIFHPQEFYTLERHRNSALYSRAHDRQEQHFPLTRKRFGLYALKGEVSRKFAVISKPKNVCLSAETK